MKKFVFLLLLLISIGFSTVYFVSPTPINGTNNFTYGMVFNCTTDAGAFNATQNFMEIDGANFSATRGADNLSISYTLPYAEHIFNNSYDVKCWGNVSDVMTEGNETIVIPYYGCGYVNGNAWLLDSIKANDPSNPNVADCFTINASVNVDGMGYNVTGGDGYFPTGGKRGIYVTQNAKNSNLTNFGDISGGTSHGDGAGIGLEIYNVSYVNITANSIIGGTDTHCCSGGGGIGLRLNLAVNNSIKVTNITGGSKNPQSAGTALQFDSSSNNNITVGTIKGGGSASGTVGRAIYLINSFDNNITSDYIQRGDSLVAQTIGAIEISTTSTSLGNYITYRVSPSVPSNVTLFLNSTNISFNLFQNWAIPPNPSGAVNVSSYLNYSGMATPSNISNFRMSYTPMAGLNESLINVWNYTSLWVKQSAGTVDTTNKWFDVNVSAIGSDGAIGLFADNTTIQFVSPTPANGTNFTSGMTFNYSSNAALGAAGNYVEVNGANQSCAVASDSLSCSYTVPYAENVYNSTYTLRPFANVSGSYFTNTTLFYNFTYYGCGVVTQSGSLLSNLSANGGTCLSFNTSGVSFSGQNYYVADSAMGINSTANVTLTSIRLRNNTIDLQTNSTISLQSIIFDNPAGGLTNYSNISLGDINSDTYTINWSSNTNLPTSYSSFQQKFINISTVSGSPSIDNMTFNWLDTESSGYAEADFHLYAWNGAWTDLNSTANITSNTMSITSFSSFGDFGILQYNTPSGGGGGGEPPTTTCPSWTGTCPSGTSLVEVGYPTCSHSCVAEEEHNESIIPPDMFCIGNCDQPVISKGVADTINEFIKDAVHEIITKCKVRKVGIIEMFTCEYEGLSGLIFFDFFSCASIFLLLFLAMAVVVSEQITKRQNGKRIPSLLAILAGAVYMLLFTIVVIIANNLIIVNLAKLAG
jgi:hypothetical protein